MLDSPYVPTPICGFTFAGDNQEEVINTTISFINILGSWGLRISKNKLQLAETEVYRLLRLK
jgi:hypothetical protein